MRGTGISIVNGGRELFALIFLSVTPGFAQPVPYFPLETGNQWVYRSGGRAPADTWTIEVQRNEQIDGRTYAVVTGFPNGPHWLRMSEEGTLLMYDRAARQDKIWAAFNAPIGERYPSAIDECSATGVIESRRARYSGPVGEFGETLRVAYPPTGCADAGITDEHYLAYVGLLRRTYSSIAGPRPYDLVYARLGGVTVVSAKEITFSLTLDKSVYTANLMPPVNLQTAVPVMMARMTLRNTQDEPVVLEFPSGQSFDIAIKNEKGETVLRWSDGKFFTMVFRTERFSGEKNWTADLRLAGADGRPLPEGRYTAEAWLATTEPQRFRASVGFEVKHVF
jgi:hypothetical protein